MSPSLQTNIHIQCRQDLDIPKISFKWPSLTFLLSESIQSINESLVGENFLKQISIRNINEKDPNKNRPRRTTKVNDDRLMVLAFNKRLMNL